MIDLPPLAREAMPRPDLSTWPVLALGLARTPAGCSDPQTDLLPPGTKVVIRSQSGRNVRVRLEDGPDKGTEGDVVRNAIRQNR